MEGKVELEVLNPEGKIVKKGKALPDDHPVSTMSPDPRHTHIFVAGGAGLEGQFYPSFMSESYTKVITKEIELPKNWDEVLEKANIVPTPMQKLPW